MMKTTNPAHRRRGRPLDLTAVILDLGVRFDVMRRKNREHNERVERRLAARPGGNRGRRVTDRRK